MRNYYEEYDIDTKSKKRKKLKIRADSGGANLHKMTFDDDGNAIKSVDLTAIKRRSVATGFIDEEQKKLKSILDV